MNENTQFYSFPAKKKPPCKNSMGQNQMGWLHTPPTRIYQRNTVSGKQIASRCDVVLQHAYCRHRRSAGLPGSVDWQVWNESTYVDKLESKASRVDNLIDGDRPRYFALMSLEKRRFYQNYTDNDLSQNVSFRSL